MTPYEPRRSDMSLAATIAAADNLSEMREEGQIVLVDRLRIAPEDAETFRNAWVEDVGKLRSQPGFLSAQLRPGAGETGAYLSIVVWQSADALRRSQLRQTGSRGLADRFLSREGDQGQSAIRRFGSVEIDPVSREVRRGGSPIRLTRKEFELLLTLASAPRRVFTRDELMDRVWGYHAALETGTLSVHMRRLRTKLEDDPAEPRYLQTVWGVGYRLMP
jgi:quinol monooxygenase YgiN